MLSFLYILAVLLLAGVFLLLLSRTVLRIRYDDGDFGVALTTVGCGIFYEYSAGTPGIQLFGWRIRIKVRQKKRPQPESRKKVSPPPPTEKKPTPKAKKVEKKKQKRRLGKLPLRTYVQLAKAGLLFFARMLARVRMDDYHLTAQPVVANPALAGMTFGWSQAMSGMFPGLREHVAYDPIYVTGQSSYSGSLQISIANRSIVYVVYRFIRDLPISILIKRLILKRGN